MKGQIRAVFWGVIVFGCFLLGGCSTTEVEDREFPLMLTITSEADFSREWLDSLEEGTKKIDYNHLKVVLIEQGFLEDDAAMSEMLSLLKKDKNVPLNAYVVTTGAAEELLTAGEALEMPLGTYLEALLERADEVKKEAYPTLGMLYQEAENHMETLFVPYVSLENEKPGINGYEAYQRGSAAGRVETDTALLSFFITNQLEKYVLQLGENNYVELSEAKNRITFSNKREESGRIKKQVMVEISCEGKILYQTHSEDIEESKQWLETQVTEYMTKEANQTLEKNIDVTNSMKKADVTAMGFYEEDIEIVFQTKIKWTD